MWPRFLPPRIERVEAPPDSARRRIFLALLGGLCVLAANRAAHGDPIQDRFAAAANLIASEREAEAATRLEALAREAPEHSLAPEALFTAAELYEEKLADPARALALYTELGRLYPDSRRALAASRRAQTLAAQVGTEPGGVDAQRRFMTIRQGLAERPERESIELAEQLLREQPDWAGAPAVAMWLASLDARAGRYESALGRYQKAAEQFSEPEARFDALRGAGDMAMRLARYDDAERYYRMMDPRGDPGRRIAIAEALAAVTEARGRSTWFWTSAAIAGLGLLLLVVSLLRAARRPGAALRAMWPPPTEVLFLVPAAGLLSAVSYTDYQGLGPAVTIVSAGGVLAAWISGAGLALRRGAPHRAAFAVAHAAAAGIAVVALLYVAVYTTDLIDPVADTLRYGPEP